MTVKLLNSSEYLFLINLLLLAEYHKKLEWCRDSSGSVFSCELDNALFLINTKAQESLDSEFYGMLKATQISYKTNDIFSYRLISTLDDVSDDIKTAGEKLNQLINRAYKNSNGLKPIGYDIIAFLQQMADLNKDI